MKYSARFMISWFGMTATKQNILLLQLIMYNDEFGKNNTRKYLLPGKQSIIV